MTKIPTVKDGIKSVDDFLNKPIEETILRDLLGKKAPQRTEIEVSFFQLCNLRCAFCWQDQTDPTGMSSIVEKANVVIDYLNKSSHLLDSINVTMTGGELFQDEFEWSMYKDYIDFIIRVNHHSPKPVSFTMVTSLGHKSEDTHRHILSLCSALDKHDISYALATSWDPFGRSNKVFEDNLFKLGPLVRGVTTVLTKQSIQALMEDDSRIDTFIKFYDWDFDYYVPTSKSDLMMPSDKDLVEFFKYMVDKHPKASRIRAWIESDINPVSCGSLNKITILPDGSLVTCRQIKYDAGDFSSDIISNSNSNIIEKYIKNNECLSCPYFGKCTLSCFVMHDHKSYLRKRELSHCLYKDVFKHIEEKHGA